ncbi:hypothetical protein [uncultured Hyphomicrobium sp.]|nr:hypothetical protein [uncultured Hyphomicrobium sp.]
MGERTKYFLLGAAVASAVWLGVLALVQARLLDALLGFGGPN